MKAHITLAIDSPSFLGGWKVLIFHLTREAISVKPSELFFLLSRTSELNIEAATEDRLVWEPRPIAWSSISVEVFCVLVTL